MNLCVVSTYNGTKEDYLKLYESFKDDIAKYTDGFEMGFVRDGKVIIVANVTDEEKFYALFEDPRSKEFDALTQVKLPQSFTALAIPCLTPPFMN